MGILFSALFQFGLSVAGLVAVYTRYSQNVSDALAEVTVEAALRDDGVDRRMHAGGAMAVNALTPIGFIVLSHTGQALVYLAFSGMVRMLGFATDHPCGDPVLTVIDEFAWDLFYSLKRRAVSAGRMALTWWRGRSDD